MIDLRYDDFDINVNNQATNNESKSYSYQQSLLEQLDYNKRQVIKSNDKSQLKDENSTAQTPAQQRKRIIPGNRTYSSATKYGKKVLLIGDSHVRSIKRAIFDNSLINAKSYIDSHKGLTTNKLEYYIMPALIEQQPDIAIINIGSNDINFSNLNVDINQLAAKIINIGKKCYEYGVQEVIISSVLIKRSIRLSAMIRQLNDILSESCKNNGMYYMSNDMIDRDLLWKDGIHLTDRGTRVLAGNMVDLINDVILPNYYSYEL